MNRVKALKGNCLDKFGDCKKAQVSLSFIIIITIIIIIIRTALWS